MPGASYGLGAAFVNGKFYAISGFSFDPSIQPRVRIYDPATTTWSLGTPLPADSGFNLRQYFGCAAANGKIYVIGGDTGGSGARDTNYVYNTATDSWAVGAPMPGGPRYGVAAVNLGGKIYVIGGFDSNGNPVTRVEIYDPSTNVWTNGTPLPQNLIAGLVAEGINGKIYLASSSGLELVFDPNIPGQWTRIADLPIPSVGKSAVLGGKFFIVGCGTNGAPSATAIQVYDPASNTWSTNYSLLPTGRGDGGVAADEASGKIYDAGGYNGQFLDELDIFSVETGPPVIVATKHGDLDYLSISEVFSPATNSWMMSTNMPTAREAFGVAVASGGEDGAWTTGPPLPGAAYGIQAAFTNGKVYAISGFAFGGDSNNLIFDPATNVWTSGAPLPADTGFNLRQFSGCAVAGGKIYIIGGDTGGTGARDTNYAYDPVSDTWATNLKPMPAGARWDDVAVNLNGKIYVIGGNAQSGIVTRVETYDPVTDSWTNGVPLLTPRAGAGAGVINGKIYVVGGGNADGALSSGEVFDPNIGMWSPIAAMPLAGTDTNNAFVLNGRLFVVGVGGSQNLVEAYDPASDTWTTSFSPLLTPRGSLAAVADGISGKIYTMGGDTGQFAILDTFEILSVAPASDKIYVAGGQDTDDVCSPIATLEAYNSATNSWSTLSSMPTARSHLTAATIKDFSVVPARDIMYFIGGQTDCTGAVGTVEAYDPTTRQWTTRQSMPVPRYDAATAVLNNQIYVFGGSDSSGAPLASLEVYDPAANQWTPSTSMSTSRSLLVGGVVGNTIYAIGGSDASGHPMATVEAFDGSSWTPRASMLTARYAAGASVVNNQIHVFGGAAIPPGGATVPQEVSTDEIYDPSTDSWSVGLPLPTARFGLGGAAINNQIYAVGGLLRGIAKVNHVFVYQITATNQPTSFGIDPTTPLPDGLTIDPASGVIFGIPTTPSHDNRIRVTATNGSGSGSAFVTFSVEPDSATQTSANNSGNSGVVPSGVASGALAIVNSTSATGTVNQPFGQPGPNGVGFQIFAANTGIAPKYTAGGLPPGLVVDPTTGLILGTPSVPGNFAVSVSVTDANKTVNTILQLTIVPDPNVPAISSAANITLVPGQAIPPYKITASGSPATFSYIGTDGVKHSGLSSAGLPLGLTFDGIDTISGTYMGTNQLSRVRTSGVTPNTIKIRPPIVCSLVANAGGSAGVGTLNFLVESGPAFFSFDPPDLTLEATGPNGAVATFSIPTAKDQNGNDVQVICDATSGAMFPLGTTVVTCTATDASNETSIAYFNVTVEDTTPPTITRIPASITVGKQKTAKGQPQGATVNFAGQLAAMDIVDGAVTPTATPSSGSFFPLGSTQVKVTATDSRGNTSAKTFTVTVENKAPKAKAPTLHVSVSPNPVNEGGSATFTISATSPDPSGPITVNYSTSCSAAPASDFYTLSDQFGANLGLSSGSITIPSGATSATVILNATSNSLSSGSETVTLTLSGGSGYKLAPVKKNKPNPNQATVTINNLP